MNPSKRRERLTELIQRLNDGKDLPSRDIKIILTDDEYEEFIKMWDSEKDKRIPVKPQSVKDYESLLKKWHAAEARVERYRKRKNIVTSIFKKMNTEVDTCLEKIQEYVQEHRNDSEFSVWLDRDINTSDLNEKFVPDSPRNSLNTPARVVTSRSRDVQSKGFFTTFTKREIKLMALERALDNLDNPITDNVLDMLKEQLQVPNINKDRFKDFKF